MNLTDWNIQSRFFEDDTAQYAAHLDALISNLEIPPLKEGEEIEL